MSRSNRVNSCLAASFGENLIYLTGQIAGLPERYPAGKPEMAALNTMESRCPSPEHLSAGIERMQYRGPIGQNSNEYLLIGNPATNHDQTSRQARKSDSHTVLLAFCGPGLDSSWLLRPAQEGRRPSGQRTGHKGRAFRKQTTGRRHRPQDQRQDGRLLEPGLSAQ